MEEKQIKKVTRVMFIALCFYWVIGFAGCGKVPYPDAKSDQLKVATTIFPYYDFVKQIGGDYVDVELIIPAGRDSHSFEPTPADMIQIEESDLFIYNGGEMEQWLEGVLDAAGSQSRKNLRMMDHVQTDKEKKLEGMMIRGAEEDDEFDEHIWTSPLNAKILVQVISDTLQAVDASHKTIYQERTEAYLKQLEELNQTFQDVIAEGKRKVILLGDKFPFYYFARDYGLTCYAAFPGCSTETEPSAATMAYLIDQVKQKQIPVVYYLELSTHKVANAIGGASGAESLLLHSCHNVTKAEFESGVTYLQLMKQNAENLRKGLE